MILGFVCFMRKT